MADKSSPAVSSIPATASLLRLASRGHSLKPSKVKLLQEEVEYLGHISTPQGIKITPGQRDAIIKMPYPLNSEGEVDETRLRSFIGLANFSRRYIDNFAMHAYLLNGLLRKDPQGFGPWPTQSLMMQ